METINESNRIESLEMTFDKLKRLVLIEDIPTKKLEILVALYRAHEDKTISFRFNDFDEE